MKRVIFALGILLLFACNKTDKGTPPVAVVQEESIKFTTNLDTGTYNVADTLPLVITVSSKLPSAGVIYSITTTWVDSSKQVFKLDTSLITSSLSLNIPGLKKSGNYSLSVTVTSKSTSSNTLNKSISIVNNPLGRFMGYKVAANARQLGEDYWLRGTGVQMDLVIQTFQKATSPGGIQHNYIQGGWGYSTCGDFNNDGFVDVFTPGAYASQNHGGDTIRMSFLIWDPINKIFKDTSLLNDKSINVFTDAHKVVPCYLNGDNFVDMVIFPTDYSGTPIKIIISDGKGGYDVQSLNGLPSGIPASAITITGGDIGDLNNDGIPDLAVTANNDLFIYWGINSAPYFTQTNHATFVKDSTDFAQYENNGFNVSAPNCGDALDVVIQDVNHDGINDIIVCEGEDPNSNGHIPSFEKVIINPGNGHFTNQSVFNLPYFNLSLPVRIANQDYKLSDDNTIIAVNGWTSYGKSFSDWSIFMYKKSTFTLDISSIIFSTNFKTKQLDGGKQRLLYYDFNGDGNKDIGYIDIGWGDEYGVNNIMFNKTVFINQLDGTYLEKSLYDYDPYAKVMLGILQKRFK